MTTALVVQTLVSAGSLASVLLAGRRLPDGGPRFPRVPWLLLVAAHGTFLAYALWSDQPGFLPLNVGMILAGLLNLRAARRDLDHLGGSLTSPTCTCAAVYAGHDRVGTSWRESCPEHGIGTDWFEHHEAADGTTMRERYELFRRRLFPTLPPDWTAEDDLDDDEEDDDEEDDE